MHTLYVWCSDLKRTIDIELLIFKFEIILKLCHIYVSVCVTKVSFDVLARDSFKVERDIGQVPAFVDDLNKFRGVILS